MFGPGVLPVLREAAEKFQAAAEDGEPSGLITSAGPLAWTP